MQTFLPYPDFRRSAQVLDYRRLGKQRVEADQILRLITHQTDNSWRNHPAVRMWQGHAMALRHYRNEMIREWEQRGYVNNMPYLPVRVPLDMPAWLGDDAFHAAHRAALLAKDMEYYSQFGWTESPTIAYVWPVQ